MSHEGDCVAGKVLMHKKASALSLSRCDYRGYGFEGTRLRN